MPTQSQDLEPRFATFLNPIRDLTKNWEVDIAKYLQEYLEVLAKIQITFDDGVSVMDFGEAALLIQGSANVYSKKVDYLWQMVLQMLDVLSTKKTLENAKELDNDTNPRTSKNYSNPAMNFSRIDELGKGRNIDLKDDELEDDDNSLTEQTKRNSIRYLPATPLHLVEKEGEKSGLRIKLFLKNFETFGNKDDFRVNRSYLTPRGSLCLELPQEILTNPLPGVAMVTDINSSIAGFFHQEPPDANQIDIQSNTEAQPEFKPLVDEENLPLSPPQTDESPDDPMGMDPPEDEFDDVMPPLTENLTTIGRHNLRKAAAPIPKIIDVNLKDRLKPLEQYVPAASRPIRAGRMRKPAACACHRVQKKMSSRRSKKIETVPKIENFITKELTKIAVANNNNNNKLNTICIGEAESKEQDARQMLTKAEKTAKTNNNETKTSEEPDAYLPSDNEVPDNIEFNEVDVDVDETETEYGLCSPHPDVLFPTDGNPAANIPPKGLSDSLLYEPTSDYEALVQQWVSEYVTNAQEHIVSSEITKRVNNWRKAITPKLELEEERCTYDIHSYGSHILSFFPDDDDRPILFKTVAQEEDPKEVSRLFLSSLMLANTYNIEFSQTKDGHLEMDCLQMKLLSRARHHKKLEEYAAPSQAVRPQRKNKDKRKSCISSDEEEEEDGQQPLKELAIRSVSVNMKSKKTKTQKTR